jgi:hypothetical protein
MLQNLFVKRKGRKNEQREHGRLQAVESVYKTWLVPPEYQWEGCPS